MCVMTGHSGHMMATTMRVWWRPARAAQQPKGHTPVGHTPGMQQPPPQCNCGGDYMDDSMGQAAMLRCVRGTLAHAQALADTMHDAGSRDCGSLFLRSHRRRHAQAARQATATACSDQQ